MGSQRSGSQRLHVQPLVWAWALLVAGALLASPSLAGGMQHPAVVLRGCSDDSGALCGAISVPWDRRRPRRGRTHIAFKLYRHTDRSRPVLGTVVAMNGGPGGASTKLGAFPVAGLFSGLLARRDLLLVDQRGTGQSGAIDCPTLQATAPQVLPSRGLRAAVGACARRLGWRANLYGSGAAADDLDAVRKALGIARIDLYGLSYGTFLAQAYAARYGAHLRSLILDSAYPARGMDIWERDNARAFRFGIRLVCLRDAVCRAARRDPVADLRRAAERLRRHAISGTVTTGAGRRVRVRLDASALTGMAYDAGGFAVPQLYEQLDAASRALLAGDTTPLLALYVDTLALPAPASDWSNGLYAAVTCHDYPVPFDRAASIPMRDTELARARGRLAPASFAPFTVADWLSAPIEPANYLGCIEWPSPSTNDPPIPVHARFPAVPTLVLAGDLDTSTALPTARALARRFPRAQFVSFANATHVLLITPCARELIARFVISLRVGDTSCASRLPPVHPVNSLAHSRVSLQILPDSRRSSL